MILSGLWQQKTKPIQSQFQENYRPSSGKACSFKTMYRKEIIDKSAGIIKPRIRLVPVGNLQATGELLIHR